MIVESPSALRLIAALTEAGVTGATREHLAQRAEISTTTFYRLIGPLIDNALVKTSGARYALAMEKAYCFRFKLWHDMERLYRLSPGDRDLVLSTAADLSRRGGNTIRALWLVGSGARDELNRASDLDFLLVTSETRDPMEPNVQQRKVSLVQMSEMEFRDAYADADSFVVSAIHDGILLADSDFAQSFYLSPPPIQIPSRMLEAGKSQGDAFREQLIDRLSIGDLSEARTALRSQAIHTGRLILRPFGVLPANRRQLVEVSRQYLGHSWADVLETALLVSQPKKDELIYLSRRIAEERDRLEGQADHLQRFAILPTAHGRSLEGLGSEVFKELIPFEELLRGSSQVDLKLSTRTNMQYLVEFKSSTGPISDDALHRAVDRLERAQKDAGDNAQCILVVNSHSDASQAPSTLQSIVGPEVLIRHRDSVYSRAMSRASNRELVVLTGLQLLRAHNRLHLEPDVQPSAVFNSLLDEGRRLRLKIRDWSPQSPIPQSFYDVFGEGGDPTSTILVLTFPDGEADAYAHRTWEDTGHRTWAVRKVNASSAPTRQVYAVAAPPEFAERMKDWGDHWRRTKMAREVLTPEDLRQNIEELLKTNGKLPKIEVSDPVKVLVAKGHVNGRLASG
jgi:hypothetical protein